MSAKRIWRAPIRAVEQVRQHAAAEGSEMVKVVARLEAEIAELDEPDRTEMLKASAWKSQHWPPLPAQRTGCLDCKAISRPAPRKSALGRFPSAPPRRKQPA